MKRAVTVTAILLIVIIASSMDKANVSISAAATSMTSAIETELPMPSHNPEDGEDGTGEKIYQELELTPESSHELLAATIETPTSEPITEPEQYTEAEKEYIARVVYAEARGECFEGQVAVACVVLNRYESGKFRSTVKKVVFSKNQFAVGTKYNTENMAAVEAAIDDNPYPANIFYFQKADRKYWSGRPSIIKYCRIGNHTFYTQGEACFR